MKDKSLALSPTMKACLAFVRQHHGVLCRFQGGFWAHSTWSISSKPRPWFGTTTVESLVTRGALIYTQWAGSNKFPVTAEIPDFKDAPDA